MSLWLLGSIVAGVVSVLTFAATTRRGNVLAVVFLAACVGSAVGWRLQIAEICADDARVEAAGEASRAQDRQQEWDRKQEAARFGAAQSLLGQWPYSRGARRTEIESQLRDIAGQKGTDPELRKIIEDFLEK